MKIVHQVVDCCRRAIVYSIERFTKFNRKNLPSLVLRAAVEFCYSFGCKDLNCGVDSLVDFYLVVRSQTLVFFQ
jgi:hypothetical protein